jgi:predicted DNA-binding transcriptional regulator AlpA
VSLRVAPGTRSAGQGTLLTDIKGLAEMLGRSERAIWRDHSAGRLPTPIKLGGLTKWRVAEIRDWVEAGCPERKTWESRNESAKRAG